MKYLIILFISISTFCHSQKQYQFDYLIEYDYILYKDSVKTKNQNYRAEDEITKKYYLTNSKNNDFYAIVTEYDSLNYKMHFRDYKGNHSKALFPKAIFDIAEFINIDCHHVNRFHNPYKYQIKNYDFHVLNDTIIEEKAYSMYKLSHVNPKKSRRRKLGSNIHIVDKETQFHLPILSFATAYEEWKTNKNLPNGIFYEKHLIDFNGNLDSTERLLNITKINKKIIIPDACNYVNKKK